MPPRKSMPVPRATPLPATTRRGQSSTPAGRRRAPQAGPSTSPRKRPRRARPSESATINDDLGDMAATNGINVDDDEGAGLGTAVTEQMDPEKELEHWQDFAVEHYEMVEQLPLELHRNYRLLRELDDGVLCKLATPIRPPKVS